MKKFLVIGNPISHSLSPTIHNYWFKNNKIEAVYEKKLVEEKDIEGLIEKVRLNEISGINITVPFKNIVVPQMDHLTTEANITKSVNTVSLEGKKVVGHNTDVAGFELAIRHKKFDITKKKILIIGAGGVVPSIIYSLMKMKSGEIFVTNRTIEKIEKIKNIFSEIKILEWGKRQEFDLIINATSVGLKENDDIGLDLSIYGSNKFFYDVIYKPKETLFLKRAKHLGNQTENGKMMFIYQAHQAFFIWNKILPKIDEKVEELICK